MVKQLLIIPILVGIAFLTIVIIEADATNHREIYFIRNQADEEHRIAFVVEIFRNDIKFYDGYFWINEMVLHSHEENTTTISNSDRQISLLAKTTTGEQFAIFYDKETNKVSYEFWIDNKQFKGVSDARVDKL